MDCRELRPLDDADSEEEKIRGRHIEVKTSLVAHLLDSVAGSWAAGYGSFEFGFISFRDNSWYINGVLPPRKSSTNLWKMVQLNSESQLGWDGMVMVYYIQQCQIPVLPHRQPVPASGINFPTEKRMETGSYHSQLVYNSLLVTGLFLLLIPYQKGRIGCLRGFEICLEFKRRMFWSTPSQLFLYINVSPSDLLRFLYNGVYASSYP
ncbi:hypothetical protein BDP27DRAFT_1367940 [Rhodocollybia butyracea]|uniref:Uncharacterized protein n=1 Tax=Rhodocollybia butyracea TaxID=206335 RepID=A0A9P5U2K1_9AGAR|nr:hypothetical protein BDP27DRAFT_1367940 [Rhodocollybia butyracea]